MEKKSSFGVAALVVGIIGTIFSFIPIINWISYILGALAIIFGALGIAKSTKKGIGIAGLILGIISIIIVIIMSVAVVDAVDKAVDNAVDEFSSSMDDLSGDNTEAILKDKVDVSFGEFVLENDGFFNNTKLPVTVTNKGDKTYSMSITIEAINADGIRIGDNTIYINSLAVGQSAIEDAFTLVTDDDANAYKSASFKVASISIY